MSCSSPAARTSEVTDHLTVVLKITLVIFIASSLLDMGLRLDPQDAARGLRNVRFVRLTLFWGFVASPALAFAITRFLPLAPSYTMGLLLMGITPCAPFLPMIVERAKGDVGDTAAFMLLTSIATIVVMPLAVPLMIEGLTVGPSCNHRCTGGLRCRVRPGPYRRSREPSASRATHLLRGDYGAALLDRLWPAARPENCSELRHGDT